MSLLFGGRGGGTAQKKENRRTKEGGSFFFIPKLFSLDGGCDVLVVHPEYVNVPGTYYCIDELHILFYTKENRGDLLQEDLVKKMLKYNGMIIQYRVIGTSIFLKQ